MIYGSFLNIFILITILTWKSNITIFGFEYIYYIYVINRVLSKKRKIYLVGIVIR